MPLLSVKGEIVPNDLGDTLDGVCRLVRADTASVACSFGLRVH